MTVARRGGRIPRMNRCALLLLAAFVLSPPARAADTPACDRLDPPLPAVGRHRRRHRPHAEGRPLPVRPFPRHGEAGQEEIMPRIGEYGQWIYRHAACSNIP